MTVSRQRLPRDRCLLVQVTANAVVVGPGMHLKAQRRPSATYVLYVTSLDVAAMSTDLLRTLI